jgi:Predicted ATPase (AAA+ superfamily)
MLTFAENYFAMTDQVFVFGKPVDDNAFTDREKESARLAANFAGGINTFIVSPRRWGKTSLVKKVIRETNSQKILCIFADVFMAKTPEEFCEILGNAVLKQSTSAIDEFIDNAKRFLGRINLGVNLSPDPVNPIKVQFGLNDEQQTLEDILNLSERIAEKKDIHIVVCIDEFQQITEFADSLSFQKQLRTVWQHQERVSYCLFGSKKHMMEGLFDDPSKPFYKFGDIIYLKRIPLSYWEEYITGKFEAAGKAISANQIERICQSVDYQSSYVQQLCWYVYLFSDDVVTEQNIDAGVEELIDQNTALFESLTENLTPVQMRFLKAVANGINNGFSSAEVISKYKLGSSAASVTTKKALLEKGLIYCEDGKCLLADPVMGLWINR